MVTSLEHINNKSAGSSDLKEPPLCLFSGLQRNPLERLTLGR